MNEFSDSALALDFDQWIRQVAPTLDWDATHLLMVFIALHKVTTGETKRLMIFMPPRHGKSEMVTVHYPVWRLERDKKFSVILGSYNQTLANKFSRRIRKLAATRMQLSKDRKAAYEWETLEGGGMRAVGVGGGITGYGGGLVIIDDPVKSRAHAESEAMRNKTWEWFTDDIYTRLTPDGAIVLIQTRWHEDDLAGRLKKQMDDGLGDRWEIIDLPAIALPSDQMGRAEGEALWPERYTLDSLKATRQMIGNYSFQSLYQQSPISRDGEIFKREWFSRVVEEAPKGLSWFRGYDLAISQRTSADRTASLRIALDKDGTLYIADGFRDRIDYPTQRRYVLERVRTERDTIHIVEDAMHGRALVQDIKRELGPHAPRLRSARVTADKFSRALQWSPLAEARKLVLVKGDWNEAFVDEMCTFPKSRNDDQADAVSLAYEHVMGRRGKGLHMFD
ncbi:MAG TPA: phage terminase large subunit [Pyrinomonadaceae bacterium]